MIGLLLDIDERREKNVDGRDKPTAMTAIYDTMSLAQFAPAVCRRSRYQDETGDGAHRDSYQPSWPGLVPAIHVLRGHPPTIRTSGGRQRRDHRRDHRPDSPTRKQPGMSGLDWPNKPFNTISCINFRDLPQVLGRRRPIWYPASAAFDRHT